MLSEVAQTQGPNIKSPPNFKFVLGTYYPEWAAQLRENYMFLGKTSLLSFQTRRQLKVGACASISAQVGYTWLFLVE